MLFFSRLFFGNAFVYYMFDNDSHIDKETRTIIITVLFSLNIISVGILWFLKSPVYEDTRNEDKDTDTSPMMDLVRTWHIFTAPNIIILSTMFFYVGKMDFVSLYNLPFLKIHFKWILLVYTISNPLKLKGTFIILNK